MTKSDLPGELFHYTSPAGAIGIISGTARATMIHYLNDALEFEYALDMSREVLLEELGDGHEKAVCEDYLRVIRRLSICTFCLSERGDWLSQWRSYCPPEGGYSIAFDPEKLRTIVESQDFKLVKCLYDVEEQRALLRPAIQELIERAATLPEMAQGIDLHRHLDASFKFPGVAAALKHPSFEEEREWRVVSAAPRTPLQYRPHGGLVIPFAEVDIKDEDSSVTRVIVGPHRHPELAARAVRSISMTELGWPLKVDHSESPFRVL